MFDALLSEAIPFKMKRYYFRLFHEIYLNNDLGAHAIDVIGFDDPQLMKLLDFIVLDDLRGYFLRFAGLAKVDKSEVE